MKVVHRRTNSFSSDKDTVYMPSKSKYPEHVNECFAAHEGAHVHLNHIRKKRIVAILLSLLIGLSALISIWMAIVLFILSSIAMILYCYHIEFMADKYAAISCGFEKYISALKYIPEKFSLTHPFTSIRIANIRRIQSQFPIQ